MAVFLGSRRLGWVYKNEYQKSKAIFPNRDSLMAQLNETPQFIVVLRCSEHEGKREILMCNNIQLDSFMSVFG